MDFKPEGSGETLSIEQFLRDYELGADRASLERLIDFKPQGSGETLSIEQFLRDYEPGADIASLVRLGSRSDYWARPENLGRWYEMYKSKPPGETAPDWLDSDGLKIAYDYMTLLNEGKHWSAWDKTPDNDDPIWDFFKTLAKPPEEAEELLKPVEEEARQMGAAPTGMIEVPGTAPGTVPGVTGPRGTYGQPGVSLDEFIGTYETFGYTKEQWEQLSPWQRWAERIFNTGNVGPSVIGAVAGLQGGPVGSIFGGVLGGALSATLSGAQKATEQEKAAGFVRRGTYGQVNENVSTSEVLLKAMGVLNAGAEAVKRATGTTVLFGLGALGSLTGDEQFPTLDQVMGNIEKAWDVSQLTYRLTPTQELLKAAATPVTPQAIIARMGVKQAELLAEQLEKLGVDVPDWLMEGIKTARPYLEGNPWAIIAAREAGKPETAWTMGTTEVRQLKNSEIGYMALIEAFDRVVAGESMDAVFDEYQKRYGFEGEMRELGGAMLADPLNFAGLATVKGAAKVAKATGMSADLVNALDSSTGIVEGIRKYKAQARLMQHFDEVSGLERWLAGAWTREGKAKILERPQYANKMEEAWGYVSSLTREARAKEVTDGLGANLAGVLDRADYDPVNMQRYVEGIANSDPRVVAEIGLRSLGGSEAAGLPMALRDFTLKGRAMVESWIATGWARDILGKISRVTGRSVDDILKSLDDVSGRDADVLARQFADAARASTDEAAQAVVKAFDDGDLTGAKLQEWSEIFVKDKAPLAESDFTARYFTAMMDHVEQWSAKYFGVKPEPWWLRMSATIKNAQGLVLLDLSPNYMFQNGIDNAVKMAYEGVLGFEGKGRRDAFFQRFGEVFRDRSETFIQREKNVRGAIAEAKVQKGPLDTVNRGIRSLRRKVGLVSEGSSRLEAWASDTASYHGTMQAWNYFWQPGKGFDDIPPGLQRKLDAIAPGLSGSIRSKIRAGLNKAEIETSIWEAVGRKMVDEILPDIAKEMGVDEAGARDALVKTGAYDYIRANIPADASNAEVLKTFDGLKQHVSKQFNDWTKQRLAAEVERAANVSEAEGALGIIDLYDEVALDEALTHIGGYDGWERVFEMEDFVSQNEFSTMLAEQRKLADEKWARAWDRRRANYLGITEQLGLDNSYARFIEGNLIEQEANWAEFHKYKWDAWKDAKKAMETPEWPQVRDQVRANIREAFIKATEKELNLQRALDAELVKVIEMWYGPEIAETARIWRGGIGNIREDMTRKMLAFRERVDMLKPEQKRAAWNKFLTEEYRPAIVERMRQNITGAHELWKAASEVEPIPPKAEVVIPAARWVEEARAQLFGEKHGLTPEQANNVNEIRRIASEFGIASAKADGSPDAGFNKRLLATVKEYGGLEYAKVEDLTPEVVRQALEERARVKGPQADALEQAQARLFKERFGLTPEQVTNVNEIRQLASHFGVSLDAQDLDKNILDTVKRYGQGEFSKVEDIPVDVARRAFEKRAGITDAEAYTRFVDTPVKDLPERIRELVVREAERLRTELWEGEAGKRIFTWVDYQSQPVVTGQPSTNADWYRSLYFDAGLNKKSVDNALAKIIEGKENSRFKNVYELKYLIIKRLAEGRYEEFAGVDIPPEPSVLMYLDNETGAAKAFQEHLELLDSFNYDDMVELAGSDEALERLTSIIEGRAEIGMPVPLPDEPAPISEFAIPEDEITSLAKMIEAEGMGQKMPSAPLAEIAVPEAEINALATDLEKQSIQNHVNNWRKRAGWERRRMEMRRVETGEAKAVTPDPVGVAPPGTVNGLYDADIGKLLEDGWDENIYNLLNSIQEKMLGPDSQTVNLKDVNLPTDLAASLRKYLEQQYVKMTDVKMAARRAGKVKRDIALLNYNHRYGFDNLLETVMPYQFWYTRSMINWGLRFIDHPAYLTQYGRIRNAQEQLSRPQEGFPARLRGKMAIPMPWLPEGWGNTVYIDPWHQVFSFEGMVNQTLRPLQQDEANRIKKAEYLLQQMAMGGQITEAQAAQAIKDRDGALWSQAMTQAQMEIEAEIANPLDLVNTMTSFSWPLQLAYQKMMKRESKINVPPSLKALTDISSFFTPGGINAGGWLQKALGAPERGFLHNYYVERELRNMVVNGEIDVEDATDAMVDQSGEAWTKALDRVGKQQAVRSFTAQLWLDFFPEGEQKARVLQQEFSAAMDAGNGAAFFDAHPEWEAQLLLSNWDDPEERMKRYLIGSVWDAYNEMSALEKREASDQLGKLFKENFLDKETRSYDSINLETMAMWAEMLGGRLPETAPKVPQTETLELPEEELSANYQVYLDTRKEKFPNASALQDMFYWLPEAMQKKFLQNNPELGQYWEWRDKFIADHPDLIPYMIGEESRLAGVAPEIQQQVYAYKGEKAKLFPGIENTQSHYFGLEGAARKAYLLDHPELKEYWDWQKARLAQSPQIIPYIKSTETIAKAVLGKDYKAGYQVDARNFDGAISTELLAYTLTGKPLGAGAKEALREIWKREKSGLTYEAWLELVYQLFTVTAR